MRRTALVLFVVLLILGGTAPALLGGKGKPAPAGCTVPSWCTGCIAVKVLNIDGNISSNGEFCGMIQEGNFKLGPTVLSFLGLFDEDSNTNTIDWTDVPITGIAMGPSPMLPDPNEAVENLGIGEYRCKNLTYVWKDAANAKNEYQLMFHSFNEQNQHNRTSKVVASCDSVGSDDGCIAWTVWPDDGTYCPIYDHTPPDPYDPTWVDPVEPDSLGGLWIYTSGKNATQTRTTEVGLYPMPHTITVTRAQ